MYLRNKAQKLKSDIPAVFLALKTKEIPISVSSAILSKWRKPIIWLLNPPTATTFILPTAVM